MNANPVYRWLRRLASHHHVPPLHKAMTFWTRCWYSGRRSWRQQAWRPALHLCCINNQRPAPSNTPCTSYRCVVWYRSRGSSVSLPALHNSFVLPSVPSPTDPTAACSSRHLSCNGPQCQVLVHDNQDGALCDRFPCASLHASAGLKACSHVLDAEL